MSFTSFSKPEVEGVSKELGGGILACVARCRNPRRLPAFGLKGENAGSITLVAGFWLELLGAVLWLHGVGGNGGKAGGGGSGGGGGGSNGGGGMTAGVGVGVMLRCKECVCVVV